MLMFRGNRKRLVKALREKDLGFIKKNAPPASSFLVHEITLHKLRVECLKLSREERMESAKWLSDRGYSRIYGESPFSGTLSDGTQEDQTDE